MLAHQELSDRIIGAAILVHRTLGPGFVEKIYEEALCLVFRQRGIRFFRQYRPEVFKVVSEGRRKATRADLELCPAKARDQTRHRAPPLLSWIPNFLPS